MVSPKIVPVVVQGKRAQTEHGSSPESKGRIETQGSQDA